VNFAMTVVVSNFWFFWPGKKTEVKKGVWLFLLFC